MPFDASELNRLAADLVKAGPRAVVQAQKVIDKTAFAIEGTGKQLAAVDTGTMQNSIGVDRGVLRATIGPTVPYAVFQEFGTSRMAPHPFMGPATDRHTPAFFKAMEQIGIPGVG